MSDTKTNFGSDTQLTEVILGGMGWLDTVDVNAAGFTVGVHEEEGAYKDDDGDLTVAGYATVNEFGTKDGLIPSRPFLRAPFDANVERYSTMLHGLAFAESGEEANVLFSRVAQEYRNDVIRGIVNKDYEKNAESTIERKTGKGDKLSKKRKSASVSVTPLIDTRRLRQSILSKAIGKR